MAESIIIFCVYVRSTKHIANKLVKKSSYPAKELYQLEQTSIQD